MMGDIAAMDYRNSPVVSIELVKFLPLNIAVESVDKLEITSAELTANVRQLNTDVAGTRKSIISVGNKSDELKNVDEAVRKRVENLESK